MVEEKIVKPISGYIFLFLAVACIVASLSFGVLSKNPLGLIGIVVTVFITSGLFIVPPNGARVLTLFGKYVGSVKSNGLFWLNPFYTKKKISLRARNFDSDRLKVNDKQGNPIMISVILVWRVRDTYKAAFEVDDYEHFVKVQTDSAVRELAGRYAYDNFDDDRTEITLSSGRTEVNDALEKELQERLDIAGIEVLEARIGYLAYAPEIANAMLKRQQAIAVVAAREKIVEGAVGMVEIALKQLSDKSIIELDEEKKATMVNNLMLVLCGDNDATPVINSGTLTG